LELQEFLRRKKLARSFQTQEAEELRVEALLSNGAPPVPPRDLQFPLLHPRDPRVRGVVWDTEIGFTTRTHSIEVEEVLFPPLLVTYMTSDHFIINIF
jgi:hypothetical protein